MRPRLGLVLSVIAFALVLLYPASSAHGLMIQSQTYQMSSANDKDRLTANCPGKRNLPYGGGMITDPVGLDGEGVYPHSYERLGVQRGWHVTPVLFDPSPLTTASRSVTLQVVCGPRLGPVSSPHSTVFVGPGETRTAVATCPKGTRLFSGGFQRTNFVTKGGNYVTESRAASDRSWQVSGSAFGWGGELTAIAYCLRSRGPLVSEVTSQSSLPLLKSGTTTTPPCPPGTSIVAGGFSTAPSGPALISSGYFNPDGSWSSTAFSLFGPLTTLTASGYCMGNGTIKRMARSPHKGRPPGHERSIQAPPILDAALKVAISERVSNNGCFPGPTAMVGALQANGIGARQAGSPRSVQRGPVNVLSDQASCDRVRLAVRRGGGVIVLDSATGQVRKLNK
jgi:hypothetical protein